MLAPDPVKTFLRHAKGDDDVHMVAVVLLRRVFQRGRNTVALGRIVINQVGNPEHSAVGRFDQLKAGRGVSPLPFAKLFDDVLDLLYFILRAGASGARMANNRCDTGLW